MSTSAAKNIFGNAPIGHVNKGRVHDGAAVDLAQIFGNESANDSQEIAKGTFITTDKDGNLEHLDANPWIKTMHQQILEKLQSGKITEAYDQLKGVMIVNIEHGLNLEDVLAISLKRSGLDDLANFVLDNGANHATVRAFAASEDGLSSLASTMAQEELYSGSPRFVCEDYRAIEMKNTQQAYEEHKERTIKHPALSYFNGRG